ncbi:MAG: dienelactone hydrolase family protein [Verrucomicrobiota bacterium]
MKFSQRLAAVLLLGSVGSPAAEPEAREWVAKDGTVVKYRWSAPEKIEAGKIYPLVLFLHGAGERGVNNSAQLKHGVIPIVEGTRKLDQPVFLIAPQCPEGRYWSPINLETGQLLEADKPNPLLEAIIALTEETAKSQPVDSKRFYVTGISMGGFATWDLLGRIPDKIAAAIPICGGGDPALTGRFANVPVWAFHGETDSIVPVKATREMVAALENAGGKPKATFYPRVDHDSWTRTYGDPAVIRWMLSQHRE